MSDVLVHSWTRWREQAGKSPSSNKEINKQIIFFFNCFSKKVVSRIDTCQISRYLEFMWHSFLVKVVTFYLGIQRDFLLLLSSHSPDSSPSHHLTSHGTGPGPDQRLKWQPGRGADAAKHVDFFCTYQYCCVHLRAERTGVVFFFLELRFSFSAHSSLLIVNHHTLYIQSNRLCHSVHKLINNKCARRGRSG